MRLGVFNFVFLDEIKAGPVRNNLRSQQLSNETRPRPDHYAPAYQIGNAGGVYEHRRDHYRRSIPHSYTEKVRTCLRYTDVYYP